jgi:hypothetical protein
MSTTFSTPTVAQGASEASGGASATADAVRNEAGGVAKAAGEHARSFVGTATDELREQGRVQTDRLADTLESVAEELHQMAARADADTPVTRTVRSIGDAAEQFCDHLRRGGPDALLSDAARFGRQRPGSFLAISMTAGFLAGRLARSTDNDAMSQAAREARRGEGPSATAPEVAR